MPVMANDKPSAENVGREFVRQYYTLLNKDPSQVHRFYSKDSVFFHGGPGNSRTKQPVVGQEEIYEQIEYLKFKDCRAKILQVDSQFTVNDSVVVQVCGEFSNNGEPTKKFVQTFVLVPEGLKKYHVRNDIFRYQEERFPDEVSDETGDVTNESEVDDEVIDERPLDNKPEHFNNMVNLASDEAVDVQFSPGNEQKISELQNGSCDVDTEFGNDEKPEEVEAELEEVIVEKHTTVDDSIQGIHADNNGPDMNDLQLTEENVTTNEPEVVQHFDDVNDSDIVTPEPIPEPQPEQTGPVSWAALAGKNPKSAFRPFEPRKPNVPSSVHANTAPVTKAPTQRVSGGNRGTISSSNSKDRFSGRNAPDNCQVFIGNLPIGLEEHQVQLAFSKFGKIVEIRLNPKNFGFVIFDNPESAEQVLKNLPISISGQEINIEEKKPSGAAGRGGRGGLTGTRGKPSGSGRGGGMNARGGKVAAGGVASSSGRGGPANGQRGAGQNNSSSRARRDRR